MTETSCLECQDDHFKTWDLHLKMELIKQGTWLRFPDLSNEIQNDIYVLLHHFRWTSQLPFQVIIHFLTSTSFWKNPVSSISIHFLLRSLKVWFHILQWMLIFFLHQSHLQIYSMELAKYQVLKIMLRFLHSHAHLHGLEDSTSMKFRLKSKEIHDIRIGHYSFIQHNNLSTSNTKMLSTFILSTIQEI